MYCGMPDIDLLASKLNYKVQEHVSWRVDPGASYAEAFLLDWAQFTNGYAFSPFCLMSRCLQKGNNFYNSSSSQNPST